MVIIKLLIPLLFFSFPCNHEQDQISLQNMINYIKGKCCKIISLKCKGAEYFFLQNLSAGKKGIEFENTHNFEFAFDSVRKNLYYTTYNYDITKPTIIDWAEISYNYSNNKINSNDNLSPLLIKLKNILEEKSKQSYIKSIKQKSENYIPSNEAGYMKNGVPTGLRITEDGKEVYRISNDRDAFGSATNIIPLNMIGRVGFGTEDDKITTCGINLAEFLDLPGPFHLHHEGEFTILWHKADYFEDSLGKEIPLSLDIWIDKNGDIRRIDYVEYYGRIWGENEFQKSGYNGEINCMSPKFIEKSYFFNDYTTVKQGIRFPLSAKKEIYTLDTRSPEGFQFMIDRKNGKFSSLEELTIKRCFIPVTLGLYIESVIDPQSLLINELIPEEIFTPPPETPRDEKMHNKTSQFLHLPSAKFIIFLGIGIAFIFLLMYLTHRYLGWSFF